MDENRLRFGVGVLVISAIGIGIILTFLFGAFPSVLQRQYTLSVVFPSAEGIGPDTPVVRDGVRIGRVSSIDLRDNGGVLVTLSMDASKTFGHNYVPQISSENFVTGDAQLEFVRASPDRLSEIFGNDAEILNKPYTDGEFLHYGDKSESLFEMQNDLEATFEAIRSAGITITAAADSVNRLATGVQEIVGGSESKFDQVADEAIVAMREFQGAMEDIRSIVGNPQLQANLESTFAQLPLVLDEVQASLGSAQRTFDRFERVGVQFERVGEAAVETVKGARLTVDSAQKAVQNIEKFTDPLAVNGDAIVQQVMQTLSRLDATLAEVNEFAAAVNNDNGTVKRLLADEDLYWQIRRTVENIEQATARVRPILDDVRIFTDKVARDPRQLGVKGALSSRPDGLGLK
jgi:phospholipid/cholesterol/gamma-HCH transport system substrate-binding protein